MSAGAAVLAWILLAVNAWGAKPVPNEEKARVAEVRQRAAESIYEVAYDTDEPPIYKDEFGRARTALLLVSLAGEESRFLERIMTGHCRPNECDSGAATGAMSVHLGRYGMRFLGSKETLCGKMDHDCLMKDDLINDWSLQFRTGVHVYRMQGPMAFTPWQKASTDAARWYAQHPPPATDEQVASGATVADNR